MPGETVSAKAPKQKIEPARRVEMIAPQRHAIILEHLRREGAASIQALAEVVGASLSTVRRDLEHLVADGYLERAHGGAMLQQTRRTTFEPSFAVATGLARREKEAIAAAAAERVEPGQSVIFDSSSTVLEAARAVVARQIPITAVTNDLQIAQLLAGSESIRVVLLGGSVRPGSFTLIGEPGSTFIGTIRTDMAFLGCHAITGSVLSETSLEVAGMKRAMIAAARRVLVLADSSKFTHPAFVTICNAADVDELLTDQGIAPACLKELRDSGIEVTVTRPPPPAA